MRPVALTALLGALCLVAARGAGAKPASQRVASPSEDAEAVEELTALLEVEATSNLRSRAASPFVESMAATSQQEDAVEASFPWDNINLHPDDCSTGPTYSTNLPAGYDSVTEAEKCNLCKRIVANSLMWNWKWHYSALCTRVPNHLVDLCKHFACRMASGCPEFITSRCMEGGAERFPCPAKYVCWNCLHIPGKQYAGCFDD